MPDGKLFGIFYFVLIVKMFYHEGVKAQKYIPSKLPFFLVP
jgi:hypothetical protein